MNDRSLNNAVLSTMRACHQDLEQELEGDVIYLYGPMSVGLPEYFRSEVEELHQKHDERLQVPEGAHSTKIPQVHILLTTRGGSAEVVEQLVNIVRYHYERVCFVIPNYAYSAGTVFCMSGNEILMDYSSVLGPIDPQVETKDGAFVPALGYLDQVNALIEKSRIGELTDAELMQLQSLDLATLRSYEQARDLTIDQLETWLVKYKFADWEKHSSTGVTVSEAEKRERARTIGRILNDHTKWKSHGRPISIAELHEMGLRITDYSADKRLRSLIREYDKLVRDYMQLTDAKGIIITRTSFDS